MRDIETLRREAEDAVRAFYTTLAVAGVTDLRLTDDGLDAVRATSRALGRAEGAAATTEKLRPWIEELREYATLLELRMGAHEARETVWPSSPAAPDRREGA